MNVIVIKYGGSLLEDKKREALFLDQLASEWQVHRHQIVLVHGGGKEITRQMDHAGLEAKFIGGRRYTDEKTMDVVEKALQNLNGQIVNKLKELHVKAQGYSGRYQNLLKAKAVSELGRVGRPDPSGVSVKTLTVLLDQGNLPVLYPVAEDESAQPLNINADDFAQAIAIAIRAEQLIFLTDTGGVLDKSSKLIQQLNPARIDHLVGDGTITGGMEVKVRACLQAVTQGVGRVIIGQTVRSDAQGFHVENGTAIVNEGPAAQTI